MNRMKFFVIFTFVGLLFFSCTQKNEEPQLIQFVQLPISLQPEVIEEQIDTTEYWVLQNKLRDKELIFEKIYGIKNIQFDKWVFVFSDSNTVKSFVNIPPSCAMGIIMVDTTIWHNKNDTINLTIKGFVFGGHDFEDNFLFKKTLNTPSKFILRKI